MQNNPLDQLHDIYDLWHIPFWQTRAFKLSLIIIIFLMLLLIGSIVFKRIYRRYRTLKPWDQAILDLEQLQKKIALLDAKEFYTRLTTILKTYLRDRYGFDVMGKTDDELIHYLSTTDFPVTLLERLQALLARSAAHKFAANPAVSNNLMLDDTLIGITLIQQTIPIQK